MASPIADLAVRIGADIGPLTGDLNKASSRISEFSEKAKNSAIGLAKLGGAAVAAGAAIGAALYVKTANAIDAQAKLAAALDTSYESLSTLTRAAELSGVSQEKLNQAARKVAVGVGQLAQGAGESGAALKQLGFSADELASLTADQRIERINQALRENVPQSQQAAIAAKIYGEEVGAAMRALDPATLATARRETRAFGLALTDVDAKQIENANDAFSSIANVIQGALAQAAVQIAPIVEGISAALRDSAIEAGGFKSGVESAFSAAVTGAAFFVDALHGIKAVFQVVADGLIAGINWVASALAKDIAWVLDKLSALPGVDYSATVASLQEFSATASSVVDQAVANIDQTLMKPMPGDALRQWVEEVKAASAEAATAQIEARKQVDSFNAEQDAVLSENERERLAQKLEQIRQSTLTEQELAAEKLEADLEWLAMAEEAKLELEGGYKEQREKLEAQHAEKIAAIKKKSADAEKRLEDTKNRALINSRANMMSNVASLMNSESRELFEIGKAAAIAQAAYKGSLAVMDAWEAGMSVGGPWAPLIAAGYAAAAGVNAASMINNIRSQTFSGGGSTAAPAAASQPATGAEGQAAAAQSESSPQQQTTINLVGDTFGRKQVRDLLEAINETNQDGGRLVIA